MKHLYFLLAKLNYFLGYYPGSSRISTLVSNHCPLVLGWATHPLKFSWLINSRDSFSTFLSSCEPFTTKVLLSRVAELDTFINIGANRGWYPLAVGARNKDVQIFAIECNSLMFRQLQQNILENRHNCELYQIAIGEHAMVSELYMPKDGNEGMSTLHPVGQQKQDDLIVERVNVTSLDVCMSGRIATLGRTLILMDIEGSEMNALKGASRILQEASPTLIIEINPVTLGASGSSAAEVFGFLRRLGYEIYWIDERGHLVCVGNDNQPPHLVTLPPHSGANYLFIKVGEAWVDRFIKC